MSKSLVDRARGLFEFLRGAQRLKASPVRTVDVYQREGAVIWLADLPEHPAVKVFQTGQPGADEPLLAVDRVSKADPPEPDAELVRWLTEPLDDPDQEPSLRERIRNPEPAKEDEGEEFLTLDDFPDIEDQFRSWLPRWRDWAAQELADRPVRELYSTLYSVYVSSAESPEELELVAGVGCLSWLPAAGQRVKRHLLTSAVSIAFDDRTGLLYIRKVESSEPVRVELDMVDPGLITAPDKVNEVREDVKGYEGHPFDREAAGSFVRRLVHSLDADGAYRDQDEPSVPAGHAVAAFAPAVILRRRTQQGLVEIFDTILGQLDESDEVPDGLIPLLNPDHVPLAVAHRQGRLLLRGGVVPMVEDAFGGRQWCGGRDSEVTDDPRLATEQRARMLVDQQLAHSGWLVHEQKHINFAGQGVAVHEMITAKERVRVAYLLSSMTVLTDSVRAPLNSVRARPAASAYLRVPGAVGSLVEVWRWGTN